MSAIKTIAASASDSITLNETPQYLTLDLAAGTTITSLRVSTRKLGNICDITSEAQLKTICQQDSPTKFTAGTSLFLPLADGQLDDVATVSISLGAGGNCNLGQMSFGKGRVPVKTSTSAIVAGDTAEFKRFISMAILAPDAADIYTVSFNNGVTQDMSLSEIRGLCALNFNNEAGHVLIENEQNITCVRIKAANSTRQVVIQTLMLTKGA